MTSRASDSNLCSRTGGFTLVELLLVLVIIAIATAVAVPSFVRSMRGNRLRAAARTVVMAGRYARSMAIMKQEQTVLAFNLDAGTVTVAPDVNEALDRVDIVSVVFGDERMREGVTDIQFEVNGRCNPYRVMLRDRRGQGIVIDVDAFASAKTEDAP